MAALPASLVYAGFSFGAATAQRFVQTRPGARGALLYEACIPITGEWAFGPWPDGVLVQIHGMDKDPFFALEGDIDAPRELVETVGPELAGLFVYPGDQHLFADSSLPSYDADRRRWFFDVHWRSSNRWADASPALGVRRSQAAMPDRPSLTPCVVVLPCKIPGCQVAEPIGGVTRSRTGRDGRPLMPRRSRFLPTFADARS